MEEIQNGAEILLKDLLAKQIEIYAFELPSSVTINENGLLEGKNKSSINNMIITVHRKFVGFLLLKYIYIYTVASKKSETLKIFLFLIFF